MEQIDTTNPVPAQRQISFYMPAELLERIKLIAKRNHRVTRAEILVAIEAHVNIQSAGLRRATAQR